MNLSEKWLAETSNIMLAMWGWGKKNKYHIFFWLITLSFLIDLPMVYRPLLYLNFLLALTDIYKHKDKLKIALIAFAPSVLFTVIGFLNSFSFSVEKDIQHIWLASAFAYSIYRYLPKIIDGNKSVTAWIYSLAFVYLAVEFICIVLGHAYGTHANPHYLALYSSVLILLFFNLLRYKEKHTLLNCFYIIALGYLILLSSSRPAWILLGACGILAFPYRNTKQLVYWAFLTVAFLFIVYSQDYMKFSDRVNDLIQNIGHEERIAIWADTLKMQNTSTVWAWIWGNGLESFVHNFNNYYRFSHIYHFKYPHNSMLEVLYTMGLAGLLVFLSIYYYLIKWWKEIYVHRVDTLSTSLGFIIFFVLLFLLVNLPFFSHFTIYTIPYIAGFLLYRKF